MKILVTGAGGPAAISVWKSLRNEHELVMADMDPRATGLYLVPPDRRVLLPRGDAPNFADAALKACRSLGIEVFISTVDAELAAVAHRTPDFSAIGVKVPLSPEPVLRMCRDKWALIQACAAASVPVPTTMLWEEGAEFRAFPGFAKPRRGSGSQGLVPIEDRSDLLQLPKDQSYLVQELLPGEEFSVDTYVSTDGAVIAAVPRERLKTDSGIAVAARTRVLPELIDAAACTARAVGVRYIANIQFKRALDGQFKLLEVNPRFPGTLPLTAAAGVDLPKLLIRELSGEPMPVNMLPFAEVMTVRYWTEHVMDSGEYEAMCSESERDRFL
jgi:carbamoyl-phosphate synthase large subunit